MARIAFFHNALCKTDGVSLEVDKWRRCLERMGHTVFYCAGNSAPSVQCIPELSFFHPQTRLLLHNATVSLQDFSETELLAAIEEQRRLLKRQLLQFIEQFRIEVLIPNNLLSVGYHLPALLALTDVLAETRLPTIAHNHDFYFEDSGEVQPTCPAVLELLEEYAPPRQVRNVVINRLAQAELRRRKGIESTVVPNVFDFTQERWEIDEYNSDFRSAFGVASGDLLLLQATRVMNRKGIELAVDFAAELNRPRNRELLSAGPLYDGRSFGPGAKIVLLCAGHIEEFGSSADYIERLERRAEDRGVDLRFVGTRLRHSRSEDPSGKVYSLWDSYVHADLVTYPSLWEGWGNQLIEAFFARLPVLLFEYPVYQSDLAQCGFDVLSLGGSAVPGADGLVSVAPEQQQQAATDAARVLTNPGRYRRMTEHNFRTAAEKFSLEALSVCISGLLSPEKADGGG